ncbi:MAG: hypothetical protein AAF594_12000 [Bacteroidota bacterium]
MRVALCLALSVFAVAPAAQPLASLSPEAAPTPADVEAALAHLDEASLQPVSCPPPAEVAPLTDVEARAMAARLGFDPDAVLPGAAGAPTPRVQFGGSTLPEAVPAETCFTFDPDDPLAAWVLQVWGALGWNLEFAALAADAGVLVPLALLSVQLMLDLSVGYFADDFDRNYLNLTPQIAYLLPLSAALYATIGAGLQAQRESFGDGSNWDVGPALTVRLVYLASVIRPLVQLTAAFLYETTILTPSVGVSYRLR